MKKRLLAVLVLIAMTSFCAGAGAEIDRAALVEYLDGLTAEEAVQMYQCMDIWAQTQWINRSRLSEGDGRICFSTSIMFKLCDAMRKNIFEVTFVGTQIEQDGDKMMITDVWDLGSQGMLYISCGESGSWWRGAHIMSLHQMVAKSAAYGFDSEFYPGNLCEEIPYMIYSAWDLFRQPEMASEIVRELEATVTPDGPNRMVGSYTITDEYDEAQNATFTVEAAISADGETIHEIKTIYFKVY